MLCSHYAMLSGAKGSESKALLSLCYTLGGGGGVKHSIVRAKRSIVRAKPSTLHFTPQKRSIVTHHLSIVIW